MSYFHVLLQLGESSQDTRCVLWDLSEKQMKSQFVDPYRKGRDLLCGSEVVKLSSIRRVRIVRTERTNEAERADIQTRSKREIDEMNRGGEPIIISFGRGYHKEDIAEAGREVTEDYIGGTPGYASTNTFLRTVNNPWVIGVVSGLVVTLLGAFIVWKLGWI